VTWNASTHGTERPNRAEKMLVTHAKKIWRFIAALSLIKTSGLHHLKYLTNFAL
jgi:hypothetical protein